jgi:hypothetical protein
MGQFDLDPSLAELGPWNARPPVGGDLQLHLDHPEAMPQGAAPAAQWPAAAGPQLTGMDPMQAYQLFDHHVDPQKPDYLKLPPPPDQTRQPGEPATRGFGLNKTGLGFTGPSWQVGLVPASETDNRYENPQNRERAERSDQDKRDADRRGESMPRQNDNISDAGQGALKQVQTWFF